MKTPPRSGKKPPNLDIQSPPISSDDPAWDEFLKDTKPLESKHSPRRTTKPKLKFPEPVSHTLDLHGMSEEKAHKAIDEWLHKIEKTGYRSANIITGLGKKGEGALKNNVPKWLEGHAFISSIDKISGGGALKLRFKRNKCRK